MEIQIIFTLNGMFMLYLGTFCPRKNLIVDNFENSSVFS